ncbi:ferredoxin--NADP reductase (plasmid) [Nitrosomonas stercoris]|uniref:Flavin-containing monooxygenase 5 n=1 Tax=Nitrosomonas stercoris TaxID=1444684 RepID=A0A4Y1YRY2_9PROT|nr:ferredoxin--NADP reductase [Nitrosomonas stercoris]
MRTTNYDLLIVGAGVSGLVTAKHALQAGLSVLIIEASSKVGGVWAFDPDKPGGVMYSTRINVSKYNYAFAGFPFPEEVSDFPDHREVLAYIEAYTIEYAINKHIVFNTEVTRLEQSNSGNWIVNGRSSPGNSEQCWTAHSVAIASGHHRTPLWPKVPGLENFKGRVLHSSQYKGNQYCFPVADKSALIIGFGNSGVDVACDIAAKAASVVISTRSGAWVLPNYIFGYPADLYAARVLKWLPWQWTSNAYEKAIIAATGNPVRWGLRPAHKALRSHPTVGGRLISLLQSKQIRIAGGVQRVTEYGVVFDDGSTYKADMLIFCTGYRIDFPFLSDKIRDVVFGATDNQVNLYMNMFSPQIGASLAFIGLVQPDTGGLLPVSEMQARWLVNLHQKRVKLPSSKVMQQRINKDMEYRRKRYVNSPRHTIQCNTIAYNDEVAAWIDSSALRYRSPKFLFRLIFGTGGVDQWTNHRTKDIDQRIQNVPVPAAMKGLGWFVLSAGLMITVTGLTLIVSFIV